MQTKGDRELVHIKPHGQGAFATTFDRIVALGTKRKRRHGAKPAMPCQRKPFAFWAGSHDERWRGRARDPVKRASCGITAGKPALANEVSPTSAPGWR